MRSIEIKTKIAKEMFIVHSLHNLFMLAIIIRTVMMVPNNRNNPDKDVRASYKSRIAWVILQGVSSWPTLILLFFVLQLQSIQSIYLH